VLDPQGPLLLSTVLVCVDQACSPSNTPPPLTLTLPGRIHLLASQYGNGVFVTLVGDGSGE
jgi:hypothetical protein